MTPEATAMLEALNAPFKADSPESQNSLKRISAILNPLVDVFKELIYGDTLMFERIFVMNWCMKEKCRVVGEFIGVDPNRVLSSPDSTEVIRFSAEMITCEVLAKIFETAKHACGVSLKEFVLSWKVLNESGEMKQILFNRVSDPDKLHPQVKEVYLEEQKHKESEDRIQQMLRDNFLSNDEEE